MNPITPINSTTSSIKKRNKFSQRLNSSITAVRNTGKKALSNKAVRIGGEIAITTPIKIAMARALGGGVENWVTAILTVDKVAFYAKTSLVATNSLIKAEKGNKLQSLIKDKKNAKIIFENVTNVATAFNRVWFGATKKALQKSKPLINETRKIIF